MASPWAYWLIGQRAGSTLRPRSPAYTICITAPARAKEKRVCFWICGGGGSGRGSAATEARETEAALLRKAARNGATRKELGSPSLIFPPKRYMWFLGAVNNHILKNHYCISEEWRPHYGGCGSRVCACAVAGLRAGAAWEHVIVRSRALAAVVQLAGRWLRKRNIHFQDLMFSLDAIWVLDLIFLILKGFRFGNLKFPHFSRKPFLLRCIPVLT